MPDDNMLNELRTGGRRYRAEHPIPTARQHQLIAWAVTIIGSALAFVISPYLPAKPDDFGVQFETFFFLGGFVTWLCGGGRNVALPILFVIGAVSVYELRDDFSPLDVEAFFWVAIRLAVLTMIIFLRGPSSPQLIVPIWRALHRRFAVHRDEAPREHCKPAQMQG